MQSSLADNTEAVAALLDRDWRMLIGSTAAAAHDGATMEITTPHDGTTIAHVPCAGESDVAAAVSAATAAFTPWRDTPLTERAQMIRDFAARLRSRARDFGLLDAIDTGNPVTAMVGDVMMAARWLDYHAGVAFSLAGATLPSMTRSWLLTRKEPYGVVGRIIPYNHPILFAAAKVGAPVITGNTLVLKIPDQAPLSSLLMAEVVLESFPPGVVNILSGPGAVTGDALVRHPAVKRLALIGSVETGQRVLASAASAGIKHVTLELGGKNAMVVCPDADPAAVVEGAAFGMNCHWSQGQSCGSTTRLFVHESLHDQVVADLSDRLKSIRIGHPLDPRTEMGCLVSQAQYDKVIGYIESAHEDGARLVTGGGRPDGEEFENGCYVEPTIFADVDTSMRIAREEVFGPVLSVFRWTDLDTVIEQANELPFGLTGAVWSNDITTAISVADRLDTGYVWINGSGSHFLGAPFGGHKNSGIGTEEGIEELESYLQSKTVNIPLR
ncbi:aldehyde dehydrogenase family protein [Mycobacterium paraseoulense]|uniref:Putative succinate-semialdehyde dehydrogenase [NADP(+)] 2 n=1 Tax=Mycobacterium paraseoulense TaxID=590652 RepID=A0A1X0I7Y5_9MYCO|nr:aldehyde dehydrogenase family protein [Mycobacterium paraseoulense]MCV7393916.1 aldehyde dehydrogenase family protein [Mycobacterium paraseoulense]ORB38359.1 aldehyde dehydrogenase [Mycobacterium paraseoulense]BBZ70455.1 aldehyde dehydrogenase [Mycobacterium paraseoulense]